MGSVFAARARRFVLAAVVGTTAVCMPGQAAPSIAELAPREALVVASVDNWAKISESFGKSGLGKAAASAEVRALWNAMLDEPVAPAPMADGMLGALGGAPVDTQSLRAALNTLRSFLEDAGVKTDEIPAPTGNVGVAVTMPKPAAAQGGDDKPAPSAPGLLVFSEYGENAEAMNTALTKALEELERRKQVTVEEEDIAGTKVRVVRLTDLEKRLKEAAAAERKTRRERLEKMMRENGTPEEQIKENLGFMDAGESFGDADIARQVALYGTWHVHRAGTGFVIANSKPGMEAAIDRLAGKGESAADSPAYKAAQARHPRTAQGHVTVLMEPLSKELAEQRKAAQNAQAGEDEEGMLAPGFGVGMVDFLLAATGFKGTQAISVTLSFDEDGGSTTTAHFLTPGLGGILKVLSPMSGALRAPAFAAADAMSAGQVNLAFDKLLPAVREALTELPADQRPEAEAALQQAEAFAGPVFSVIGPEVIISESLVQPMGPRSHQVLFAVRMRDAIPIQNLINLAGGGMLKPRDFEGSQIYETPGGMGIDVPVLGIGKDFLFVGPPAAVENALRQSTRAEGGLATNAAFSKAATAMKPDAIAASWLDARQYFQMLDYELRNPTADPFEEMMAQEENREPRRPAPPTWVSKLPPANWWTGYFGDLTFQMHAVQGGLDIVSRTTAP
ncbi:MAG: hypothetical protein LW650_06950 [Planctomycetaceae bacterium]|jgi:hypothetical protein|nr:hypothetical protein [Phycisphaerales bacterium]MCE2653237.1 hypothetical protein [Planctomycetaceae bacterium]